jgi:hypothetical protein
LLFLHEKISLQSLPNNIQKAAAELGQELRDIFLSFEKCLRLREEYQRASFQCAGDNPKDLDEWEIYRMPMPFTSIEI